MKFFNRKKEIASEVIVFDSVISKFIGLRFKDIKQDTAWLFPVSISMLSFVDTFFVKSSIDIFFLDKNFRVLKAARNVKPFRFVWPCKNTSFILETAGNSSIKINDVIHLFK